MNYHPCKAFNLAKRIRLLSALLLPLVASAQVAVRTQCPRHSWNGPAGANCPSCVAEASRNARPAGTGRIGTSPVLSPGMQVTTDILKRGVSTAIDAALKQNSPPAADPQRAAQLQQEAELARRAEEERHERLLGRLKLSGAASSSVSAPVSQDNPLGLKLGPSVLEQPAPGLGPDGLAPRGTPFFGLGGNGTPGPGASEAAPSTRPGADRSAISQLNTAAGGGLRPLDFKRLPASIKQNAEFLKLNQQRNESIAQFEEFKAQIEALRTKLAASGANIGSIESNIRVLEAKQQQQEVFIDFSNREMKRQWKVDVEEQ